MLYLAAVKDVLYKNQEMSTLLSGPVDILYFKNDILKPILLLSPNLSVKGVPVSVRLIPSVRTLFTILWAF
jgi:hypothetical protein